jgi:exodeoxyribonuclease III
MRIATWNVNSIGARLPRVLEWLERARPDVLCVQELKCPDESFPHDQVGELGYQAAVYGLGRWNGVAVLSRVGLADVTRGLTAEPVYEEKAEARAIGATCGGVRVWSVYVPNGREPAHPHYEYKLSWLEALRGTVTAELSATRPFAVLGDFNIAPTDDDVWDPTLFVGSTHVSEPEREALRALERWGLHGTFRRLHPEPGHFTYWDYRAGMFHKGMGMRIDLLLATAPVADAVTAAVMDRDARKGTKPSDHAPVYIDVEGF